MNGRKIIPLDEVYLRESHLKSGIIKRNPDCVYPLYQTYNIKEQYNFKNLRESLEVWYNFSNSVTTNINQTCDLLKIIDENGTPEQLMEATDLVCNSIIPYLPNPNAFKYNYNKLRENGNDKLNRSVDKIFSKITEQVECDRVLNNYNLVSKRFNVDKLFLGVIKEDFMTETIFTFCDLMETYDIDLKTKYCIANECALKSASKHLTTVNQKPIVENVIDYYLTHYGTNDVPRFISTIRDCIQKDRFIGNEATEYLDYLEKVYNNMDGSDYEKEYFSRINEDIDLSLVAAVDKYNHIKNGNMVLYELALIDKTKELFTKFKLSKIKTISMVKEAIKSCFDNITADDVKSAVKAALKIAFFALVILAAFAVAFIAIIIGFICSLIYSRFFSDKAKLKAAIDELKEHKSNVKQKMKNEVDGNRKERMDTYITELSSQINRLQVRYEEMAYPTNRVTNTANGITDLAKDIGSKAFAGLGAYHIASKLAQAPSSDKQNTSTAPEEQKSEEENKSEEE